MKKPTGIMGIGQEKNHNQEVILFCPFYLENGHNMKKWLRHFSNIFSQKNPCNKTTSKSDEK